MVFADGSDDGDERLHDVGGVERAADPRFDHGDINVVSSKVVEGEQGGDLKVVAALFPTREAGASRLLFLLR